MAPANPAEHCNASIRNYVSSSAILFDLPHETSFRMVLVKEIYALFKETELILELSSIYAFEPRGVGGYCFQGPTNGNNRSPWRMADVRNLYI